ncbi:hypothetical protein [Enterobacter sp. AG5470]|uniref:hypothetical protein n=1 Tax=Kosakonia sp. WA-90 TaxID=3153576 RepID=UPI0010684573|nr:hypothetical protein DFO53_3222 [Enterobacter sp. AG5470]
MTNNSTFYAKLGENEKIHYISLGEQLDPTMFPVDYSSELYREFYSRMPAWAQRDIPAPSEKEAAA